VRPFSAQTRLMVTLAFMTKFRPDSLPVIGLLMLTSDNASRFLLDLDTPLWRNRRFAARHLRKVRGRDAQFRGKTRSASAFRRDVSFEVHASSLVSPKHEVK